MSCCCKLTIRVAEADAPLTARIAEGGVPPRTQSKTATPSQETQVIEPDRGYLLENVTVNPIPQNYGLITYNGYSITVS